MDSMKIIVLVFMTLIHGGTQMDEIKSLRRKFPGWSFEVESMDSMLQKTLHKFRTSGVNYVSEDIVREKVRSLFHPDVKYVIRKTNDPKWVKVPPATFDAREHWSECKNLIKNVDDEGACLTDSPVVVASMLSDRYCIYTNGTKKDKFSSEWLTGCAEMCTIGRPFPYFSLNLTLHEGVPTGGSFGERKGCLPYTERPCRHVWVNDTLTGHSAVLNKRKIRTCDKEITYDHDCPTKCSNKKYSKPLEKDKTKVDIFYYSPNEWMVRNDIMSYGPMTSSILLFSDFYNFKTPTESFYQRTNSSIFVLPDKFFKIIGWGTENGVKYWLCINSWTDWGANKAFKIPRAINYLWVEWMMWGAAFKSE